MPRNAVSRTANVRNWNKCPKQDWNVISPVKWMRNGNKNSTMRKGIKIHYNYSGDTETPWYALHITTSLPTSIMMDLQKWQHLWYYLLDREKQNYWTVLLKSGVLVWNSKLLQMNYVSELGFLILNGGFSLLARMARFIHVICWAKLFLVGYNLIR